MKIPKKIILSSILILMILVTLTFLAIDYFKHKDDCCSCCPESEPDSNCIAMCCQCKN